MMALTWVLATASNMQLLKSSSIVIQLQKQFCNCVMGLGIILLLTAEVNADSYVSRSDFLAAAFDSQQPEQKMYWLDSANRDAISAILGHPYRGMRIRYWQLGNKFAWILDEVGKEKPITVGIVVSEQRVAKVTVLDFRETRGGEVRYEFFTRQFIGARIDQAMRLDQHIDGITGATLSVRAVKDVTTLALFLSERLVAKAETLSAQSLSEQSLSEHASSN